MRRTLTLLVASTGLAAAIAVPVWSAVEAPGDGSLRSFAALVEEGTRAMPLVLASDDDDSRDREGSRRGHDDDDDDDDDDDCRGGAGNPAPAGTVAPPNGLFGNGAPPQVRVN